MTNPPRIAVLIPCHDEAASVATVVADFRRVLPGAAIHVYDNASADDTAARAAAAGAIVRAEPLRGKGNVVRRMFADIQADYYVLVDGDGTYDAATAVPMLAMMTGQGLDMVTGTRVSDVRGAWRPGHRTGNRLLAGIVRAIFGNRVTDMLSGYRVFSRRFVKSFPALSKGFETETEFTIHALELRMRVGELPTAYRDRMAGSASKLRTWRDGTRILRTIVMLVKEERPLQFFAACALALALAGVAAGVPVIVDYLHTGLVPRLPTAVLATGLVLLAALSLACGLILDTVTRGRRELKHLHYLSIPGPLEQVAAP